jgi:hypothetical protein
MFDEGTVSEEWRHREQQKETSPSPPLHNPTRKEPDQWGTHRKKEEAKSKPLL